jgi:biopolymer transport protein TolQ
MTPNGGPPNILDMISGSGPVVQAVLYLLILTSVASWAVVLYKARQIRRARKGSEKFVAQFWEMRNLTEMAKTCDANPDNPVAAVFKSGYQELVRLRSKKKGGSEMSTELSGVANVERAMRRAASLQRTELEKLLTFLATVASAAPFVGLFGTVWGIMNSFLGLAGGSGATTIQAVAPGISEALVATAMGLAAAIPALVAYNHFARQTRVMALAMENFSSEFLNIAERHFLV